MKVFMGHAVGGQPTWETFMTLRQAIDHARKNGVEVEELLVRGGGSAAAARAVVAHHFLKSTCDFWIHVGNDVTVPKEFITSLVGDCKDVVGAVYPKKTPMELIPAQVFENHDKTWQDKVRSRGLVPAVFISGDAFCFKREVIETLWNKHTELTYFYPSVEAPLKAIFMPTLAMTDRGPIYLEEDWAICHRARLAGFEIWVDCSIQCLHYTGIFKGFGELNDNKSLRVNFEG